MKVFELEFKFESDYHQSLRTVNIPSTVLTMGSAAIGAYMGSVVGGPAGTAIGAIIGVLVGKISTTGTLEYLIITLFGNNELLAYYSYSQPLLTDSASI